MKDWKKIADIVDGNRRFALTAHMQPEGDALGAELGLYHHLKTKGKEVKIINNDPTIPIFDFLDPKNEIEVYNEADHKDYLAGADVIFILDVSSWDYMGRLEDPIKTSKALKICIDHHVKKGQFADIDVIDTNACATGELVYDFLKNTNGTFDIPTATAIYTAVMTDTGVFRFPNTTSKSHLIAADLLSVGIDHEKIYESLYENNTWSKLKLLDLCIASIKSEADGKIAWIVVTNEMLQKSNASWNDADALLDIIRTIRGVKVALIFRETESEHVKVHFRSKDNIDVQQLAIHFGGGGHRLASGANIVGRVEEIIPRVLEEAKKLI